MSILTPVSRLLSRFLLRLYPHRDVFGRRTIFTDLDADREACAERIAGAASLLMAGGARYRAQWLRIRHIVVWPGHFTMVDELGGIHLSAALVPLVTDLELASILVHES